MTLDSTEEQIVSDYIARNWVFVTGKLQRDHEGTSRLHPLAVSFPTQQIVYPMRLTGQTHHAVFVELYVIAPQGVESEILPVEVRARFQLFHDELKVDPETNEKLPGMIAVHNPRQQIGHPQALELMWDGCCLTKLCGILTPEDMREDIVITPASSEPYRKLYFTRHGAFDWVSTAFLAWYSIGLLTYSIVLRKKLKRDTIRYGVKLPLKGLVLSLFLAGIVYAVLPKTDVQGRKSVPMRFVLAPNFFQYASQSAMESFREQYSGPADKRSVVQYAQDFFPAAAESQGISYNEDDLPGTCKVLEDERGVILRFYDPSGFAYDYTVPSKEAVPSP